MSRPRRVRKAGVKPFALDGYGDIANPVIQQQTLDELKSLGGNVSALWRVLVLDPDPARLRREREAFWEHRQAVDHADWLAKRLAQVRGYRIALQEMGGIEKAVAELLAEEQEIGSVLHRVLAHAGTTAPEKLAADRRRHARPDHVRVHHEIPPVREMRMRQPDSHLRAIRRYFVPKVIRMVYPHVERIGTAIKMQVRCRMLAEDPGWNHPDRRQRFRAEQRRRASQKMNDLTARLVRVFYPFWGKDVSGPNVRVTMENAKRRS